MARFKILFSGLANAGKSSIMRVLDNDLEKIPDIKPTFSVELKKFKVLGLDVVAWDMGGQTLYRQKYISDFRKYFGEMSILFYVVDFQAEDTYEESFAYLKSIVDVLDRQQLQNLFISVWFHKFDPHIRVEKAKLEQRETALRDKFEDLLRIISHKFYETSIYEPHTLSIAFSESLLHLVSNVDVMYQKVRSITEEFHSYAGVLVSYGGQIYGAWHSKNVQIVDLIKFNRTVHEFSHLITDSMYSPFIILPLTEMTNIAAVVFSYEGQFFALCVIVPKLKDFEDLKVRLLEKREELKKIFSIFKYIPTS